MLLKKVDPNHFVFGKNYVKPIMKKGTNAEIYQIRDDDDFFKDLPDAPEVKRAQVPGITKKMRLERQRKLLEEAHARVRTQIAKQEEKNFRDRAEEQKQDQLSRRSGRVPTSIQ